MKRFLLIPLVVASMAAPGRAQQPAPSPAPATETPEARATRHIAEHGEAKVRAQAVVELWNALDGRIKVCPEDLEEEKATVEEAMRYYAKAHGLTTNIEELMDNVDIATAAAGGDLGRPRPEATEGLKKIWGNGARYLFEAVRKLRELKKCEAPKPVSSTDTGGGGGLSKNARIGIGAGGGVALIGVLAAGGGTDPAPSTPSQPPALQPPTQTPAPTTPSGPPVGAFSVHLVCIRDVGQNDPSVRGAEVSQLEVGAVATTINFGGASPWVGVSGTWDTATGRFSAVGRGRVAGIANVRCNFEGTLGADGILRGEMIMGSDGALPGGQPVHYRVEGRKN